MTYVEGNDGNNEKKKRERDKKQSVSNLSSGTSNVAWKTAKAFFIRKDRNEGVSKERMVERKINEQEQAISILAATENQRKRERHQQSRYLAAFHNHSEGIRVYQLLR